MCAKEIIENDILPKGANTRVLFCDKHNISYEARSLAFGLHTNCPKCNDEILAYKQAKKDYENLYNQERKLELEKEAKSLAIESSGIPLCHVKNKYRETENIKRYKDFVKSNKNLFIFGDVGVGKTYFAYLIIRACYENNPLYINGNEITFYTKLDFSKLLTKIQDKNNKLIIIDEVFKLLSLDVTLLDSFFSLLYDKGIRVVMIGNFVKKDDFLNRLSKRVISRLSENLECLEFKGQDLRLGKVSEVVKL